MSAVYDVFLSHNAVDKALVEAVAERLQHEGLRPYLDSWELIPGEPWIPALELALESSGTIAVFFGPLGGGAWHAEEAQLALVLGAQRRGKRVIPVLLPGARTEDIGSFMLLRTPVELGEDNAIARLIAGITGRTPGPLPGLQPEPNWKKRLTELSRRQNSENVTQSESQTSICSVSAHLSSSSRSQCKWRSFNSNEDCFRSRMEGFEYCRNHLEAFIAIARESRSQKTPIASQRYFDKFILTAVATMGASVVTQWDSICEIAASIQTLIIHGFSADFDKIQSPAFISHPNGRLAKLPEIASDDLVYTISDRWSSLFNEVVPHQRRA